MKNTLLAAIFALPVTIGLTAFAPQQAAYAAEGQACQTAEMVRVAAQTGAAKHGGKAIRLDGIAAVSFVDYLNNKVGEPTDYRGDTVIIGLYPDLGYALVGFVVNGCAAAELVKIDPASFLRAYKAALGTEV